MHALALRVRRQAAQRVHVSKRSANGAIVVTAGLRILTREVGWRAGLRVLQRERVSRQRLATNSTGSRDRAARHLELRLFDVVRVQHDAQLVLFPRVAAELKLLDAARHALFVQLLALVHGMSGVFT